VSDDGDGDEDVEMDGVGSGQLEEAAKNGACPCTAQALP
jgi:hypothetical protein